MSESQTDKISALELTLESVSCVPTSLGRIVIVISEIFELLAIAMKITPLPLSDPEHQSLNDELISFLSQKQDNRVA